MPISVPTWSTPNCPFLHYGSVNTSCRNKQGLARPIFRGFMKQFNLKKSYIPYLHTLQLSHLRIIVVKDGASISAKFVCFFIKKTLFKSHTTSKSECERFQFVQFKFMIMKGTQTSDDDDKSWIDITIAYSLKSYDRDQNVQ